MVIRFNFENLEVYNDAVFFANAVYKITRLFPKGEVFGITNQLRRASLSVSCNIAEGSSRGKKEFRRFLNIALGSNYECIPLLEVSKRQKYVDESSFDDLLEQFHKIAAKLNALKNSLR